MKSKNKCHVKFPQALLLAMLIAFCTTGLCAQVTLIPDPVFEQHLIDEGFDSGTPDGQVSTINIQGITDLDVGDNGAITDLTGIEDMKDLVMLDCKNNKIEDLDFSGNLKLEILDCSQNLLKSLNVTKNLRLKELACSNNELTQLDLTQNFDLLVLDAQFNALSELDVNNNSFLEDLGVYENALEALNLSNNVNLIFLYCSDNKLSELNISNNKRLEIVNCGNNLLTEIDVSQNKELQGLFFTKNEISTLDITQNEQLSDLVGRNNQLANINLSIHPSLKIIDLSENQLTNLDVSMLPLLTVFNASNNSLQCLNIQNGNNSNVVFFSTQDNPSLTCIQVDDPAYSDGNWTMIDPGVSFELICESSCTVGTEEVPDELAAKLFPNPSTEAIYIEFEDRIGEGTWTMYNPIGQKMLMQDFANTDLLSLNPELSAGVYLLQVALDKGLSKSFKIIRK